MNGPFAAFCPPPSLSPPGGEPDPLPQQGRGGGQSPSYDRTYAVEGCGEAQPPRIPLFPPAAASQPGATPTALPPRAGNNRLVEGLRPSTPPRRKATAYLL